MPAQDRVKVDMRLCEGDGSKMNPEFLQYRGVEVVVASTEDQ